MSDPTNLHAIDEIKFATGLGIEAVVVEDDKLQKAVGKAMEQVDTSMPTWRDDEGFDLENLDVTGGEEEPDAEVTRDDVEDAPIVRFVNKILLDAITKAAPRTSTSSRTRRLPRALAPGRRAEGSRDAARAAGDEDLRAPEGHVAPGHRRAPRSAGRPHQDAAVEEPRHRLPRQHLPDAVRREDRAAYSRSLAAPCSASMRWATSRCRKSCTCRTSPSPQGMILVTGPTGSGKTVSLYTGPEHPQHEDTQHLDGGRPGGNQHAGRQPGQRQPARSASRSPPRMRAFLRQDPDVIMVGEIRDLETAEIAIKAAQTGHLVLSTPAHQRRAADADASRSTWA